MAGNVHVFGSCLMRKNPGVRFSSAGWSSDSWSTLLHKCTKYCKPAALTQQAACRAWSLQHWIQQALCTCRSHVCRLKPSIKNIQARPGRTQVQIPSIHLNIGGCPCSCTSRADRTDMGGTRACGPSSLANQWPPLSVRDPDSKI